jgi:hypothetical protein
MADLSSPDLQPFDPAFDPESLVENPPVSLDSDQMPPTDFQEIPPSPDEAKVDGEATGGAEGELFHETREGRLLSQLINDLELPEVNVREQMIMVWKKMENYWRDRQYIIWDDFSADWRTPGEIRSLDSTIDIDPAAYAKIVNIYKAHGEAIISALSAGLPYVRFFPDDADSQDDIFTAKSYTKLSELIQKRNKGQLIFIKALFYLYNFGTVFAYNENKDTDNFGTVKRANYVDTPVINRNLFCPQCGLMQGTDQFDAPQNAPVPGGPPSPPSPSPLGGAVPPPVPIQPLTPQAKQLYGGTPPPIPSSGGAPTPSGSTPQVSGPMGMPLEMAQAQGQSQSQGQPPSPAPPEGTCPGCGAVAPPDFEDYDEVVPRLVGYTQEPKSHEFIEVFSGLHVKFPHWCTSQAQTPYLTLETEEHISLLQEIYPEVGDRITPSGDDVTNERMARRNSDYHGDTPLDLATFSRSWIRPWAFNKVGNLDDVQFLKQKYPDGVYIAKIEDLIVEGVADKLDDHWTVTVNPLSIHVHADPLAQPLVPVQDVMNELTNLTLETIEFGIPETFYESDAIDSDLYKKSEARPGMLYPAKSKVGMGLDSSFHTIKTSALSQEVDNFADRMNQAGQFVSGAFPTIWGGAMEGGGGTAKEYESSRAMALQRLNLTWIAVKNWWSDVMSKAVRSFAANMKDDERYVEQRGNTYLNVWIRRAEMQGKIGQVEPDVSEAFPISWAQKRDILMNLMGMKDPMIGSVISHPENAGTVAATIGFPDLYIPGDDDRNKQLYEISQMLLAAPTPTGIMGPDGQEALQPSVAVNQWDNHSVEAETCKAWLKSEVGLDCQQTNPAGWMNIVSHMKMHDFQAAQQAAMQAQNEADQNNQGKPGEKPPGKGEGKPPSGGENG